MADDNVGLGEALVLIGDENGTIFESGAAVEVDAGTGYWMYTALNTIPEGTTVVVKAQISDRPGNIVEATEVKEI